MGVCMHGDGSEDPLVPWLHKDCPAGGGGCPHPWPLGSPGEDQGDAFCRRCCMLWHPWMHPWHDGPPQTRADVDGMPKQHWMHAAGACMCANRWHTVCTCAHYAGSSDPSHCPHAPHIYMHLYMHMGGCMHGYMYVCRCVGVYGRRSERRSFFRGISPQDLLAALLSLCIYLDIEISRHIYT